MQMKRLVNIACATTLLLGAAACYQSPGGGYEADEEAVGTITGALLGAAAGSTVGKGRGQTAAVVAGSLLGAYVGGQVGQRLQASDVREYQRTSQTAMENNKSGSTAMWRNPDTGVYGSITPLNAYQEPSSGQYCREYTQTINVGGRNEEAYGVACRQPDGSWKIRK